MAKKKIPEEQKPIPEALDFLIKEYLTDDILTPKERQVILKEAEALGLDRDKIDLYLDAQVQKIDQATDAAIRKQKGKTCPYCGKSVPQLADKCPHCDEEITVQASEELQQIFDNLEDALVDMKSGKDFSRNKAKVDRYARKAKMYYGNNPKIQKLLTEIEYESCKAMETAAKKEKALKRKEFLEKWWSLIVVIGMLVGSVLLAIIGITVGIMTEGH